jgi:hypothetical protein
MEKMSHSEYIEETRRNAGRIAVATINGEIGILESCFKLAPLLAQAELPAEDPDSNAVILVSDELDGLPLGEFRRHWAPEALEKLAPEIESATAWAQSIAMPAIHSIAARFGA